MKQPWINMTLERLIRNITVNSTCGSPNSKPSGVFLRKKLSWLTIVAALAVPMYNCEGDTTEKNYYGNEGGNGGSGSYSCESACQNMSDCCKNGEKKKQHCYDEEKDQWKGYVNDVSGCVNGCENNLSGEWSEGMIKCNALYCNPDDVSECDQYQ